MFVKSAGETIHTQKHYTGKDSLYKFATDWELNAYEFDILKRIVRCRRISSTRCKISASKNIIFTMEYV